ncbi:hypothetical protein [Streptomyces sp. NPDC001401]|uniref:hypothetical protein n=1 Tax=Streptomyces sp. NPDC001401 TaxID=3364570 RepID=UPI003676CECD
MAKVEQRHRRAAQASVERDAEAGEQGAQYGGFDAEVEGRRQRAMSVSPQASMHPRPRLVLVPGKGTWARPDDGACQDVLPPQEGPFTERSK